MSAEREAKKKAIGAILKLANDALGKKLEAKRQPKPAPAPAQTESKDLDDDDTRRLIELYESKQEAKAEA